MKLSMTMSNFDLVIVTETNLSDDICDAEICPSDYTVFRCDRSILTSAKSSKGGVMVAVRDSIVSSRLFSSIDDIECLLLKLQPCKGTSWLLVACYIPPQEHVSKYNSLLSSVEELISSGSKFDEILIVGDFNLPGVNWDDTLCRDHTPASRAIISMMQLLDLQQVNQVYNKRGVLLDLVLCSHSSGTVVALESDFLLPVEESHHPPLSISIPFVSKKRSPYSKFYTYDLKRCDVRSVQASLSTVDFAHLTSSPDINQAAEDFLSTVAASVRLSSPRRRVGVSPFPRWFSADLKNLVILKKTLHKRYKQHPSAYNYCSFSNVRALCKASASNDYRRYVSKIERGIPGNPRLFWSHVNTMRNSSSVPPRLIYDGCDADEPYGMCELFRRYFSSVYTKPVEFFSPDAGDYLGSLAFPKFSTQEVLERLSKLDENKGWGPDEVPPKILRHCRELLAAPICDLFNKSVAMGIFPDAFKPAYVVPIHKKGPVEDVCNYRPISILSALSKVFEGLFLDRIKHKVSVIICPGQHGFTAGRSTVSNLIVFQSHILEAFSQNKQLDSIYLDFSKAFDTVDHSILLRKMVDLGFGSVEIRWLASYLSNRRLFVKFASSLSSEFVSESGVPQGSILGPYLFCLFINDLPMVVRTDSLLFADDAKIYCIISTILDCMRLQYDLEELERWCEKNKLFLNMKKCQVITFHRCHSPLVFDYQICGGLITRVHEVKDLGIILTPSLSCETHILSICNRANKMLGFVSRFSKHLRDEKALKSLYSALVRQILEYGSPLWNPCQIGLIEELEKVQRRFVRILGVKRGYAFHEVPIEDLSRDVGLQPLCSRRYSADIVLLHRILNGKIDCPDIVRQIQFRTPSCTRSSELFVRQHHRTNFAANCTMARLQRAGNSVSHHVDFFHDSVMCLKRKIGGWD